MFENIEAVDAFQGSDAGQALLDSMQKRGLQGLTFWHNGMKQMSANVPLMSPADANGLKFRVMSSDVLVAQMEALRRSSTKNGLLKSMVGYSKVSLMGKKTRGQTFMVRSFSKYRTVSRKPTTVLLTIWL